MLPVLAPPVLSSATRIFTGQVYKNTIPTGQGVYVIFFDLSKVFDRIPRVQLIQKLNTFGKAGILIDWFNNYLTGRKQRVVINEEYSDWLEVTSRVPQGSILGPLLFLVYINDMPNYINFNSRMALFVYDSKIYKTIQH